MPIVMFYNKEPQFVLHDVKRGMDGGIRKAEVVNGAWTLRVTETEHQALSGRHIVNRWPKPADVRVLDVPAGGDYNDVLARAVDHAHLLGPLPE